MELVIKAKQNSIKEFFGSLINGGIFIFIGILCIKNNKLLWGWILICGTIRFSVYSFIDLWVSKTIFERKGKLYIRCWGIKFRLNPEKSFLIIDDMLFDSWAKFPALYVQRNPSFFLGRLFKNRIKLYSVNRESYEVTRKEAFKISETFGIQFKDIYDFD